MNGFLAVSPCAHHDGVGRDRPVQLVRVSFEPAGRVLRGDHANYRSTGSVRGQLVVHNGYHLARMERTSSDVGTVTFLSVVGHTSDLTVRETASIVAGRQARQTDAVFSRFQGLGAGDFSEPVDLSLVERAPLRHDIFSAAFDSFRSGIAG